MRPQVNLSPDLVGVVRMRESLVIHTVSLLVLMVLYMYVTLVTKEFRYFRDGNFFYTVTIFPPSYITSTSYINPL